MNTSTQEQVKTKVPTGVAVLVVSAVLVGVVGAGYMLMNAGIQKASKKTTTKNTNTAVNTNTTTSTATATATAVNNGIWISIPEIRALPITGETGCLTGSPCATAWNKLKTAACGTWVNPYMADQRKTHAAYTMAGALVYIRQGDAACTGTLSLRDKVRDAIIAAKRTMDEPREYSTEMCVNSVCIGEFNNGNACTHHDQCRDPATTANTLGLGRQLAGYVIAADLIDLPTAPLASGEMVQADAEFRPWLISIRDEELLNSNAVYGKSLRKTYENWAHNWSSYAGASMIAAALYLGETPNPADHNYIARADAFWRSYGVRGVYPTDTWVQLPQYGDNTYFGNTLSTNPGKCAGYCLDEWKCDVANWTAFSPACSKTDADGDTANIDGAFIEDIERGPDRDTSSPSCVTHVGFFWGCGTEAMRADCVAPPVYNCGMQYEWSGAQGLVAQAEMLHRAGYDAYGANNLQLKRMLDFIDRAGWNMHYGQSQNVPMIANYRYRNLGVSYPIVSPPNLAAGYSTGWTDWTHGAHRVLDTTAPTGVGNVSPSNGTTGVSRTPTLTAVTATDASVPVSYSFELYAGTQCTGTPVQQRVYETNATWTPATSLSTDTTYSWRNQARDNVIPPNESTFSPCWTFTTISSGGGGCGGLRDPDCQPLEIPA